MISTQKASSHLNLGGVYFFNILFNEMTKNDKD